MTKAIITINYVDYVVESEVALQIADTVMNAERYTQKGYGSDATHFIYDNDKTDFNMRLISDDLYRMAKLAGKPPENN